MLAYILPVLMLYLIVGTIAQKYIGLYAATKIFFSSAVIWLGGFMPLPGLPIFLAFIFINLLVKLIFKSPWSWRQSGIILTHIGVLMLLLGGFLTAVMSAEGYIDLAPDQTKAFVSDYHAREFVLLDHAGHVVRRWDHSDLRAGQKLELVGGAQVEILTTCRHCDIQKRVPEEGDTKIYHGMAKPMMLTPGKLRREDEENLAGMRLILTGVKDTAQAGVYVVLEGIAKYPVFDMGGETYRLALRRAQRALPFSVTLLDFKRDMHPGTMMAKSYQSRVKIMDGEQSWESTIRMNEPLRYKGYTLYQASFVQTGGEDISVLSVVQNAGRVFPYLSGILMSLGLLIHLFLRKPEGQ